MSRNESTRHQHRVLSTKREYPCVFSVCCLVTRWADYEVARKAFKLQGFVASNSEFLVCDNSLANHIDAYQAIRVFLRKARGRYVILAHQDVYPLEHCKKLLALLFRLEKRDRMWGVVGNAGIHPSRWPAIFGSLQMPGGVAVSMPKSFEKVKVLDENLLLVKNGCGITCSADLAGYHLYGFDLCSVAARLGFSSYAINYLWHHESHGNVDKKFFESQKKLEKKIREYFLWNGAPTTCSYLCWSSSDWDLALAHGRSLFINLSNSRRKYAREYLWKTGLNNRYFLLALAFLGFTLGPRILLSKIYRLAQKLGLTKTKSSFSKALKQD